MSDAGLFAAGLVALVAGAELLVRGASKLALVCGISPLVVGLTVVAFGTSSPELAVSVRSSLGGQTDIALGNVVGSNIFNVLFILGVAALITPLVVAQQLVRQEVPIMIGASLLLAGLTGDHRLSRLDGVLLVGLLVAYTTFLVRQSRRNRGLAEEAGEELALIGRGEWDRHWTVQVLLIAAGLGLLTSGANWLVVASIAFARSFGVSELVIGLTVLAAGTSLPEVATSLLAAVRGQRDIAVGNVVGSNVFNLLGVLGLSAAVSRAGLPVGDALRSFDLPVMIAVSGACLPIFFSGYLISRWEGAVFVAYYAAYTGYLVVAAQQHDALATIGLVMTTVVIPLTALTIGVIVWREWRQSRS